jgi:hypothetical protein
MHEEGVYFWNDIYNRDKAILKGLQQEFSVRAKLRQDSAK